MTINVNGISSKGTTRTISYLIVLEDDTYKAVAKALEYANREYDENLKPILNSEYKEFEAVTSIEVIDD